MYINSGPVLVADHGMAQLILQWETTGNTKDRQIRLEKNPPWNCGDMLLVRIGNAWLDGPGDWYSITQHPCTDEDVGHMAWIPVQVVTVAGQLQDPLSPSLGFFYG